MSTDDVNAGQYINVGEGVEVIADNDDLQVTGNIYSEGF